MSVFCLHEGLHVPVDTRQSPKGIVGGFEFTVFQRSLKEWHERPWTVCLRVLKESNKSRFDSYSVRNSALIIFHVTFRDGRLHIFSDNFSRNSCICVEYNPLSPNSAQDQFSPNDIHRLSWAKSMRINKMITKRKIFDLLPNSLK